MKKTAPVRFDPNAPLQPLRIKDDDAGRWLIHIAFKLRDAVKKATARVDGPEDKT